MYCLLIAYGVSHRHGSGWKKCDKDELTEEAGSRGRGEWRVAGLTQTSTARHTSRLQCDAAMSDWKVSALRRRSSSISRWLRYICCLNTKLVYRCGKAKNYFDKASSLKTCMAAGPANGRGVLLNFYKMPVKFIRLLLSFQEWKKIHIDSQAVPEV